MATTSVFLPFKLGRRLLACERDMEAGYILIADGVRTPVPVEFVTILGERGWKIHWRWEKRTAGRMKPGVLFTIQLPETLDTIGVSDDGFDVYVENGEERIPLSGDELQMLNTGRQNKAVACYWLSKA